MANLTDTYYAAEGGFHGYGSQLLVGNGASPETFEAIAEVSSIQFGDMTTAVLERTHLRSPEAHREKLAGLRDSGPFAISGNWRPTHESQSNAGGGSGSFVSGGLIAMWRTRVTKNFILRLSDGSPGTELPFRAFVSKFQPGEIGPHGKVDFSAEMPPLSDFSASLPYSGRGRVAWQIGNVASSHSSQGRNGTRSVSRRMRWRKSKTSQMGARGTRCSWASIGAA